MGMPNNSKLWQERIGLGRRRALARIEQGAGFIYVAAVPNSEAVKVGFSLDPERRIAQLGYEFRLMGCFPASQAAERALHVFLSNRRHPDFSGREIYSRDVFRHAPAALREAT